MRIPFFEKIKHRVNHILFSNKFYNVFLKPFDKILFERVSAQKLKEEKKEKITLNKICQVSDIHHPLWKKTSNELKCEISEINFHRKDWEYTQIIFSLKKLKSLSPQSTCLAVGAGRENLLYYLTHKVKEVIGIDLYEGFYYGGEDQDDIPGSTERYAPFPYQKDKLKLFRMDALNLEFPENHFDFIFSSSSIEHFGAKKKILRSLQEMFRVLKPGGIVSITTELKLNSLGTKTPNVNLFYFKELQQLALTAGFNIPGEFDMRIEEEYFNNWVKLPEELTKRPHVFLRFFNTIFTSIHLILQKKGQDAVTGEEIFPEIPDFIYRSEISADSKKNTYNCEEPVGLDISIKNRGNFKWINSGMSHRISLGIQLYSPKKKLINRDYATILIPTKVDPGKTIHFRTTVKAPENKGDWIYRFELKKELVFWFSEHGDQTTDLCIKVC